ncbi:MAG: prolipoprotein diacylglyceryl transferase [bacterium]|nr:prolipoprotein diacylglyceryl transferase [bacterium]
MSFLHTFTPDPILYSYGFITVHWYGLFMALALLAGFLVSLKIARWHGIKKEIIQDLFLYLVVGGFVGARVFYILYNPFYFWQYPLNMFKIWEGGIAIHGGLLFGFLTLMWFTRLRSVNFWQLTSIIVPGLALGQAVGRWGNYFNQELFGRPTSLPWGIPIEVARRPAEFAAAEFFQPTFLYESLGNLIIFITLILAHLYILKISKGLNAKNAMAITLGYLAMYSMLRFVMEFMRTDSMLNVFNIRVTQLISGVLILLSVFVYLYFFKKK